MNMKGKILIADDEIHILRVLELKFKTAGYEVIKAETGREAWDKIVSQHPEVIISDYQMPEMNGLELAEDLFETPELRDIPIILLTARGFSLTSDDLLGTNIIQMITKPFSPRALLSVVENMLEASGVS